MGKKPKKARKATRAKRSVRGPQLAIGAALADAGGKVPAGVKEGRTPVAQEHHSGERLRYLEPPKKKRGNPFVAVRVPREMKDHWDAWLKRKGKLHPSAMREAMAKLSGYRGDTEGSEGDDE